MVWFTSFHLIVPVDQWVSSMLQGLSLQCLHCFKREADAVVLLTSIHKLVSNPINCFVGALHCTNLSRDKFFFHRATLVSQPEENSGELPAVERCPRRRSGCAEPAESSKKGPVVRVHRWYDVAPSLIICTNEYSSCSKCLNLHLPRLLSAFNAFFATRLIIA